ncbi:rCG32887 [Rattus norvegicus]|uniref:RCG32887 n=1 Tax=Rattus norvegicus TaxID=10116 RepID=A6HHP3_RAT|nr:rCG32887 [Rattus norvegicus]
MTSTWDAEAQNQESLHTGLKWEDGELKASLDYTVKVSLDYIVKPSLKKRETGQCLGEEWVSGSWYSSYPCDCRQCELMSLLS